MEGASSSSLTQLTRRIPRTGDTSLLCVSVYAAHTVCGDGRGGVRVRCGLLPGTVQGKDDRYATVKLADDTLIRAPSGLVDGRHDISVGVRPENKLAVEAGLEVGPRGGIRVNEHLQTSDPDIYAVGDAIEVTDFVLGVPTQVPLAGPANRQGRLVADHIFGRDARYRGTQGTAIVRVFEKTAAMTGASEKALQRAIFGKTIIDPEVIRMLLFGLALVLMMLYRPAGILPSALRKRELETNRR